MERRERDYRVRERNRLGGPPIWPDFVPIIATPRRLTRNSVRRSTYQMMRLVTLAKLPICLNGRRLLHDYAVRARISGRAKPGRQMCAALTVPVSIWVLLRQERTRLRTGRFRQGRRGEAIAGRPHASTRGHGRRHSCPLCVPARIESPLKRRGVRLSSCYALNGSALLGNEGCDGTPSSYCGPPRPGLKRPEGTRG